MTHDHKSPQDAPAWVDDLLQDVSDAPIADTPPAVMARVLDDAMTALPAPGGQVAAVPLWRQIVQGLGGWMTVGGLAAATVAGFAVGLNGIDATGVDLLFSTGTDEYYESQMGLSAYGWDLEEG